MKRKWVNEEQICKTCWAYDSDMACPCCGTPIGDGWGWCREYERVTRAQSTCVYWGEGAEGYGQIREALEKLIKANQEERKGHNDERTDRE